MGVVRRSDMAEAPTIVVEYAVQNPAVRGNVARLVA